MIIKNTILLALAGLLVGISGAANASCTKYGKVEQVYQNTTYAYIFIKRLDSYSSASYHYCYTADRDMIIAAHAAKDGNSYVRVTGNASSCPSSGSGSMSACSVIVRY